ncbi:MAG: DNA ligase D [Chitinophagaceae bacterium]
MGLTEYRKKRSFKKTPEPEGGKVAASGLRFVVQMHAASHLHYDFRLEMDGVLKSWAVPKGPSTDPSVKRLAMMVEDHPYDYRNFEGSIPKGQYGGGTVIVWDEGTYMPAESAATDKSAQDKELRSGLRKGKIVFTLNGQKLKGDWALVKSSYQGENSWLLMKMKDRFAKTSDITKKDKSVLSGKTIKQIEKNPGKIYGQPDVKKETVTSKKVKSAPRAASSNSGKKETVTTKKIKSTPRAASSTARINDAVTTKNTKPAPKAASSPARKKAAPQKRKLKDPGAELVDTIDIRGSKKEVETLVKQGKKEKFPVDLSPMFATLVDEPFDSDEWIYEVKWDGYRAVAFVNGNKVELKSRNNKSFDEKFYPVYAELKKLGLKIVLDGEVIVVNDEGRADFGRLQNWRSEADGELKYYVFDILYYDGYSLLHLPLSTRRKILASLIPASDMILLSQAFDASGTEFFKAASKMKLEGIMAKKLDSDYKPGLRTKEWLKIKVKQRQEVVIGGYTRNDGTAKAFSALLVGVYKGNHLHYTGKVGTGFSDKLQQEMMAEFKKVISKTNPFTEEPDINKPSRFRPDPPHAEAVWLKPVLVCEVSFAEMTTDSVMRHPSFEGMRSDKKATQVKEEKAMAVKKLVKESVLHEKNLLKTPGKQERKTLLNPTDESQERTINGEKLKFSNLNKIYWPKEKFTKRDLLNYYYQIAPYMLPYLKNRPQSLNRYPNGIEGQSFYQKDVKGKVPDWIETFPYRSETEDKDKEFLVASNEASLLYMASLGAIELNPWSSTIKKPDHPDWCIIDLDPDTNTFDKVIETALVTKEVLDAINVDSYVKTSGSTGIHIYIPLGAKYTYEHSKEFARVIVTIVQSQLPKFTSIERATKLRKGKIYLDFLQNRPQATLAAPYSARPKPGATVSTPLNWDEVKKGLKLKDFTIKNVPARVSETGDLFKPVLGKGINMQDAIKKVESTF